MLRRCWRAAKIPCRHYHSASTHWRVVCIDGQFLQRLNGMHTGFGRTCDLATGNTDGCITKERRLVIADYLYREAANFSSDTRFQTPLSRPEMTAITKSPLLVLSGQFYNSIATLGSGAMTSVFGIESLIVLVNHFMAPSSPWTRSTFLGFTWLT